MKIDIAEAVRSEGEQFSDAYSGAFESIDFLGEQFEFPEGVTVDLSWRYDGEGVIVSGRLDTDMRVRCARCLESFMCEIGFHFAEYYKKQPDEGEYAYSGETIDLSQMLEDNVVINLPTRFLCKSDCKGLCSRCGNNLNESACGCPPQAELSGPFAGLAGLHDHEEV